MTATKSGKAVAPEAGAQALETAGRARATAICIDGNSIGVVAGEWSRSGLRLLGTRHHEGDEFLEVIKRIRHPIFMNINLSWYPDKEVLIRLLRDLLASPAFCNPVVAVIQPEKIDGYEAVGEATGAAAEERRTTLLQQHMPGDPFAYPHTAFFQEVPRENGQSETRLWMSRLTDILPLMEIVKALDLPILGLVPARRAARQVVSTIETDLVGQPVTVCHVGKLRTMYTTRLPDGRILHNPIPVGMARDDVYYFESFRPTVQSLKDLKSRLGHLLLPPEMTPSPIGTRWVSTPQLDCTRFASQISRYALRAMKTNRDTTNGEWDMAGIHFLSGRGSRFPGLDSYMRYRICGDVRPLAQENLPGLGICPDCDWGDVRDELLSIGALLEVLIASPRDAAILGGNLHPLGRSRGRKGTFSNLEPGRLYFLEQPLPD